MNISHPGVPASTITSKNATAKAKARPQSSEVEQQSHRHIHRPAGIAMRAVRAIPTVCHCGVRAAPGDGICSLRYALCDLFWSASFGLAETVLRRTRANAEIEAGWGGADAAKKAEVLTGDGDGDAGSIDQASHGWVRIPEKPRNWRMAMAGLGRWIARKRSELIFLGTADQDCLYLE